MNRGKRPSIGITPDLHADEGMPFPLYQLKLPYAEAVFRAGGLPMVLPYTDDALLIDAYLERVSGVVVTGGAFDIPPEAYGEQAREGMGPTKPPRTAFETGLLRGALERGIPVLGICGGMQLLNVVLGGTLFQDIRREVPGGADHEQKHDRTQPHHPVEVVAGTQLAVHLGQGSLMVNSTHHQAVRRLGQNVVAAALSPDGVVEAIETSSHRFAIGVQWHPEYLTHSLPAHLGIYRGFINAARELRR